MARKTRSYTKGEQLAVLATLASNGGNLARTATETGVPRKTLAEWAKRQGSARASVASGEGGEQPSPPKKDRSPPGPPPAEPFHPDHIKEATSVLADELERAARGMVLRLFDKDKLDSASLKEISTSTGILIDKVRLLRDQPTSINANGLTDEQRAERLATLVDAARTRRNGRASGGLGAPAVEPAAGAADAGV